LVFWTTLLLACEAPGPAVPIVLGHGGAPGSDCIPDGDQVLCDPTGVHRVQCVAGAWNDLQACALPERCFEGTAGAHCRVQPLADEALGIACSRYVACMPSYSSAAGCVDVNERTSEIAAQAVAAGYLGGADEYAVLQAGEHKACIVAAKDCAEVEACVRGPVTAVCPSADGYGTPKAHGCQGTVGWLCKKGRIQSMDCAQYGLSCGDQGGYVYCSKTVTCSGPKQTRCEGDVAVACTDGKSSGADTDWVALSVNCAGYGLKCRSNQGNSSPHTWCVGAGGLCPNVTGTEHCVGGKLRACYYGGWVDVDCEKYGESCQEIQGVDSNYACVPKPCATPDACNGDVWTWCQRGQQVSVDCGAAGLSCGELSYGLGCVTGS
jgi:hypothetical protein